VPSPQPTANIIQLKNISEKGPAGHCKSEQKL